MNEHLVNFCIKLIKTGENNLIFQRAISLSITDGLIKNAEKVIKSNCSGIIPLIVSLISTEEYRGYDSAVYCYNENKSYQFYVDFGCDLERSYYGAVPRFIFITAFQNIIKKYYK